MSTPYAQATSGVAARDEITKLLRRFGCTSIGFLDNYEDHEVLLVFKHRGRQMQLRASAKGWAALYLKEHPYNYRHKGGEHAHCLRRLHGHFTIKSAGEISTLNCWHQMITL